MDYNSKKAGSFIEALVAKGRYTFTTIEASHVLKTSPVALRAALRRLRKKKWLIDPVRGFQLILPPEYRSQGCMPCRHSCRTP